MRRCSYISNKELYIDPGKEQCSFKFDLRNVEASDTKICNMNAESLVDKNPTKSVQAK